MDSHTLKDTIDKLGGSIRVKTNVKNRSGFGKGSYTEILVPVNYEELLSYLHDEKMQCFYDYDHEMVCCIRVPKDESPSIGFYKL
ncbi:MAG: hypothetical protein KKA62_01085 [Nanoarchaeota archaeon]|nr:hypothetical protein [Nanoarchaeota archaeon]MBU1643557.1 hypothetical protein [Nanoarchaeota archaeon]MBU1976529.1 hypothetical protein [Nanoarchaeota archaeon]